MQAFIRTVTLHFTWRHFSLFYKDTFQGRCHRSTEPQNSWAWMVQPSCSHRATCSQLPRTMGRQFLYGNYTILLNNLLHCSKNSKIYFSVNKILHNATEREEKETNQLNMLPFNCSETKCTTRTLSTCYHSAHTIYEL